MWEESVHIILRSSIVTTVVLVEAQTSKAMGHQGEPNYACMDVLLAKRRDNTMEERQSYEELGQSHWTSTRYQDIP